ncbi:MAG: serpin family protein [Balneolaceae bacterium]|nr:MAG: serpin family protein [Balneolaceae bacterium]
MKTIKLPVSVFVTSIIIFLAFSACDVFNSSGDKEPDRPFERRELPRSLTAEEIRLVDGSGSFGFELLQKLVERNPESSHFISPLSIIMAYGMTMNGANGDTYSQMLEVFGLESMEREEINVAARDLIGLLSTFDDKVTFNIANSIWYREGYPVANSFLDVNKIHYDAVIEAVNFGNPQTLERINGWVKEKTGGLIEKITDDLDPQIVMYLLNAIYFKGDWSVKFDADNTAKRPFYLSDGSVKEVDMMQMEMEEEMEYKYGENYEAVNLLYGDAGFAMTLIMPDESTTLEKWLSETDWETWNEVTSTFSDVTLTLGLPKFELEYEVEGFEGLLMDLGIVDAFDPYLAIFEFMTGSPNDLFIGESKHKTFISVNEEGTEAAAVTSVVMFDSAPQVVEITFNRPFFYVIREVESGTILFMGTFTGEEL